MRNIQERRYPRVLAITAYLDWDLQISKGKTSSIMVMVKSDIGLSKRIGSITIPTTQMSAFLEEHGPLYPP